MKTEMNGHFLSQNIDIYRRPDGHIVYSELTHTNL